MPAPGAPVILKMVFRHIRQAPTRTVMCALIIAVIACAMQLADHMRLTWTATSDIASARRLITRNHISITQTLPLTYADTIRAIPGVKALTHNSWLGGYFRKPAFSLDSYAIPDEGFFSIYTEYTVPPEAMRRFLDDRTGVLIGEEFARIHGLRIGDTVTIEEAVYPGPWEFRVSGVYTTNDAAASRRQIFVRWAYFDERLSVMLPHIAHNLDNFTIELRDPTAMGTVAKLIDQAFENSAIQTFSEAEEAFTAGFVAMLDSRVAILNALTAIGMLACLMILGSVSAIAALTRRQQLNHLRVIGFPDRIVAVLLIAEPLVFACLGVALGLLLARVIAPQLEGVQGVSVASGLTLSGTALWRSLSAAAAVGLAAGLAGCMVVLGRRPADVMGLPS